MKENAKNADAKEPGKIQYLCRNCEHRNLNKRMKSGYHLCEWNGEYVYGHKKACYGFKRVVRPEDEMQSRSYIQENKRGSRYVNAKVYLPHGVDLDDISQAAILAIDEPTPYGYRPCKVKFELKKK